jgi:carboxyl-terminal processing protease
MNKISFCLVVLLLLMSSCSKDIEKQIEDKSAKLYLDDILNTYYYWYDRKPQNVSMYDNTIDVFFKASLYGEDRWSWMTDIDSWNESQSGSFLSYGGAIAQPIEYYHDYGLYISYVFPDSPYDRAGVKRGWKLTHLNGVSVMELVRNNVFNAEYAKTHNSFTFVNLEGDKVTLELIADKISTRSYLVRDIFTNKDYLGLTSKVGYFNYRTFNHNMLDDISETFQIFHNEGVKELILDLRYNSGGSILALEKLANLIAPSSANGEIILKTKHNSKMSKYDEENISYITREAGALDLKRIFFITGSRTASASEAIINGLSPFFDEADIIQVGDTTYGKPNGMYSFSDPDKKYIFLPICFYNVNKNNEGDYDNGLLPSYYCPDDLYHDWGVCEGATNACLYYIVNGYFPTLPPKKSYTKDVNEGSVKIKDESDDPNYGLLYILP